MHVIHLTSFNRTNVAFEFLKFGEELKISPISHILEGDFELYGVASTPIF